MTNTNVTEYYGKEEAEQLENYIRTYYAIKVPEPKKPSQEDLSFWNIAGFETISFFIPSIAFAIFSAIRTSGFFFVQERELLTKYNLPEGFVWLLSLLVMITGILGFEGILLARGIKAGRSQKENEESKSSTNLSLTVIVGIGVYIGLSMLTIPENVMLYIDVIMALLTGVGGGIITFFGGNDIGYAIKKYDTQKIKIQKTYQENYNAWYESAVSSYISAKKQVAKISGVSQSTTSSNSSSETNREDQKKLSKFEIAYNFISDHYGRLKAIPTNKYISENSKVALGTAYSALQKFLVDNAEELISEGKITEKELDDAKRRYYGSIIKDFISKNNRFMNVEEINQLLIPQKELARFIAENEEMIVQNNLLDRETVQQALNLSFGKEG